MIQINLCKQSDFDVLFEPISDNFFNCKQLGRRLGSTLCLAWYRSKLLDTDGIPERFFEKVNFEKKNLQKTLLAGKKLSRLNTHACVIVIT